MFGFEFFDQRDSGWGDCAGNGFLARRFKGNIQEALDDSSKPRSWSCTLPGEARTGCHHRVGQHVAAWNGDGDRRSCLVGIQQVLDITLDIGVAF